MRGRRARPPCRRRHCGVGRRVVSSGDAPAGTSFAGFPYRGGCSASDPSLLRGVIAMSERNGQKPQDGRIKDPSEWTTGDEPMTGAQESYLNTLAREAGEDVNDDLTKAEASEKIDDLREKTGRATPAKKPRAKS